MGHGVVEYRGGVMLNCHEGTSGYVGRRLLELAETSQFTGIAPAVRVWQEALELAPGCSAICLDDALPDEDTKSLFIAALTEVHASMKEELLRLQVRELIKFLVLGESALASVFKPLREQR